MQHERQGFRVSYRICLGGGFFFSNQACVRRGREGALSAKLNHECIQCH